MLEMEAIVVNAVVVVVDVIDVAIGGDAAVGADDVVVELLSQPQWKFRVAAVDVVLSKSVVGLKVVAGGGVLLSENVVGLHLDFRKN